YQEISNYQLRTLNLTLTLQAANHDLLNYELTTKHLHTRVTGTGKPYTLYSKA
ncbi:hypothetical protein Bpfe_015220, partial [Biomphalaria pfeifferi]